MPRRTSFAFAVVASICAFASHAALGAAYQFTDLTPLFGPGSTKQVPLQINDAGVIAGTYNNPANQQWRYSFVYDAANGFRDIGSLRPGAQTEVASLNNAGRIVGNVLYEAEGENHGFLYQNGTMTDLGLLPGSRATFPAKINNLGQVVGSHVVASPGNAGPIKPVRWENGVLTEMPTPSPIGWGALSSINDSGVIVGGYDVSHDEPVTSRAVVYRDGVPSDLPGLGGNRTGANDINASGLILGSSQTPAGQQHAVLWRDGQVVDLGTVLGDAAPTALNDAGVGVGFSYNVPGNDFYRATIYKDGQAVDLNTLVDLPANWALLQALDINNLGQIVGVARYQPAGIPSPPEFRPFLLTPVPEPGSIGALMTIVVAGLLRRRNRGESSRA